MQSKNMVFSIHLAFHQSLLDHQTISYTFSMIILKLSLQDGINEHVNLS